MSHNLLLRPRLTILLLIPLLAACGGGSSGGGAGPVIIVNSLEDIALPPEGTVTLRSAIDSIGSGGTILFDPALDGGTIPLSIVGDEHSVLMGEVFPKGQFAGYTERDYGRSALYARKNLVIDASALPNGITLEWTGGAADPARVLAVFGDLTMRHVTLSSGYSVGEPIAGGSQSHTLARGAGLVTWGTAVLEDCALVENTAVGDENPSRDRAAFGGGVYGNRLLLTDCMVSGNSVTGYGAAGGGVYSVGGWEMEGLGSVLTRCCITGNHVAGEHAYGGGAYSDGGGRGNTEEVVFTSCTIARNKVEDHPGIPEPPGAQYYFRGGGIYMSNGTLVIDACTIVENEVTGIPGVFRGKPNMGGGGVAATIGNAHVVDSMRIGRSIIAGNTVNGVADDVYSGSLINFYSRGYNLFGKLDFSQILVPIPPWWSLCRKHWPEAGDRDGVALDQVLSLAGAEVHPTVQSAGVGAGANVVLWYPPAGEALDRIPDGWYLIDYYLAVSGIEGHLHGEFLNRIVTKLRTDYSDALGTDFGAGFGDLSAIKFAEVPETWPGEPENEDWIQFWRDLETEIDGRLGTEGLGEAFWADFGTDPATGNSMTTITTETWSIGSPGPDQLGTPRGLGVLPDVGAIER